jgi:hypothetical protein
LAGWHLHPHHAPWHHGHWQPAHWPRPGRVGVWGLGPVIWGTPGWELGSLGYSSGLIAYENPYVVAPINIGSGVTVDYARPLETVLYADPSAPAGSYPTDSPLVSSEALQQMDAARAAFRHGDYSLALRHVNAAMALMPGDASMHEFRALVLFAQGQYRDAAAALNSLLAVGPGWNWTTMIGLYPGVDVYTAQLRALESYVTQHPEDAAGHFVLAYHYLTEGHILNAVAQFQAVARLAPRDVVAPQIVNTLTQPPSESTEAQAPAQPVPAADPTVDTQAAGVPNPAASESPEATAPVPEAGAEQLTTTAADNSALVGAWSASRPDGSSFKLTLTAEGKFNWVFGRGTNMTTLEGVYSLEGDTLSLEDPRRGTMAAQITFNPDGSLTFRRVGALPGEADLIFRR